MLVARSRPLSPASITQFPEWMIAGLLVAVGVRLLMPGATLAQPNYVYMRDFAGENTWAAILIVIGTVRASALACNRFGCHAVWSLHARAAISFPSAFFWSKMGFLIHRANPDAILPVLCFAVASADVAILYLVAFQAGLQDKARQNGDV